MGIQIDRRGFVVIGAAGLASPSLAKIGPLLPGVRIRPDREQMIAVPGGRAYVRINGNLAGPRPPLICVNGGPGSSHANFLNATSLADERAVILYDQLDTGRSDQPGKQENWRVERFVDELAAIGTALSIGRWHVLGASWGGTVALEYAARRPAELASVVLQSPLVSTALWLDDARRLQSRMPPATRRTLAACERAIVSGPPCEVATEAFYARHVRRDEVPAAVDAYAKALPRRFSTDLYEYMWGPTEFSSTGTLRNYDGRPLLEQLEGRKTLFLAGRHDEATPATVARFARIVPHASFRVIEHSAHSAWIDNPVDYAALLRIWMAQHDRA